MVDNDGSYVYSKVVRFNNEFSNIRLWPYLTVDYLYCNGLVYQDVKIVNQFGIVVLNRKLDNTNIIDVSSLAVGMYFVITNNQTIKFIMA